MDTDSLVPLDELKSWRWSQSVIQYSHGTDKNGSRFELVPFHEISLSTDAHYLIKGLVPREGLIVLWGMPKCGKSFIAFDLGMHIARGYDYRGRRVKQGRVVYIACEGERGLGARAEAYRREHLADASTEIPFYLLATRLDLVGEHPELIADIHAQTGGTAPALIIIDTLNRTIAGSESSDRDMGDYVKAADAVREAFGCAVLVVHHCGHETTRPRGHTSLTGAADAQIALKKDGTGLITCTVEFMKDGQDGDTHHSRLRQVDVGIDDDGEPITSCVVVPAEDDAAGDDQRRTGLSDQARIALRELEHSVIETGAPAPASVRIPRTATVVRIDHWRQNFENANGSKSDKPDSRRRAFQRQLATLKNRGLVGVWGDYAWLVGQAGQTRT